MAQTIETTPASSIEARLALLEAEVASLKQQVTKQRGDQGWLENVIGSSNDMPDFDDVVRYGREARQAQPLPDEVPG